MLKQKIQSGYQFNRVFVYFLSKVAVTYGTEKEKRAANLISESGICFLSGRLGVYAPISAVGVGGTSRDHASRSADTHGAFEFDEDDLGDPAHVPDMYLPSESVQQVGKKSRLQRMQEEEQRRQEREDAEEGGVDAGVLMRTRIGNARRRD